MRVERLQENFKSQLIISQESCIAESPLNAYKRFINLN